MTAFYSQHDRLHDSAAARRLCVLTRRIIGRIIAALRIAHQGIVSAKTHRFEREMMFHEIPQQPLMLGDKWDF
jgi:hypothetical protein